jgi:hypothetical protein
MAHFAEIGINNEVLKVIVVNNKELLNDQGIEKESLGQEFCRKLFGGNWIQTSFNSKFRKNYAGIGYTYDVVHDAFIPPRPYNSWVLDEETCLWQAPIPMPNDESIYTWNENLQSWQTHELSE